MDSSLDQRPFALAPGDLEWVRETRIGKWFLSTKIWYRYVLAVAVEDCQRLLRARAQRVDTLLDIGCGQGASFTLLDRYLQPKRILGIDIDARLLDKAAETAAQCRCGIEMQRGKVSRLPLPDGSVDMIFCHQLIHHIASQEAGLAELYRVLKPGGFLLLSESCKPFIYSWAVRWFFRHPMHVQRTAEEYLALVRATGFRFSEEDVQLTTPWWSLSDFGLRRRLGLEREAPETTELIVVARKPV